MVYGAIDLHTRYSHIRIVDADGIVLRHQKVLTTRERLVTAVTGLGDVRILVEASTESEWVAQALEDTGHEVIVADPNYGPMYGALRRRVKTDDRDVEALAEANRRGWYRAAHRVSRAQRTLRQRLGVRRQLVRMRSSLIAQLRAILRQEGLRLPSGTTAAIDARLARVAVPSAVQAVLTPLLEALRALTPLLAQEDRALTALAEGDPIVRQLQTTPGVGPIVGLTYRATLDTVDRFPSAGHVSSCLGLVPGEDSSGERRQRGHITKMGPSEVRSMLIQAAWTCCARRIYAPGLTRSRHVAANALRSWRSPGASVASCLQSGAMGRRLPCRGSRRKHETCIDWERHEKRGDRGRYAGRRKSRHARLRPPPRMTCCVSP